jgi:superfamily II DNA or RNA helicase
MLLRPRQETFIKRIERAVKKHGNTLGVGPTGFGKTICLSTLSPKLCGLRGANKVAIIQHTDELTAQNFAKFQQVNPHSPVSVVNRKGKSWLGDHVFCMVQTLARSKNLDNMPALDALIIDEGHRAPAPIYQDIIGRAKEINPKVATVLLTATPQRGDKKPLCPTVTNVGDQVTIGELIASGHLVRPRTMIMDVGVHDELKGLERDDDEVARILNHPAITSEVIRNWREHAADRQTAVFCSNVQHTKDVCAAFNDEGIRTVYIHGLMPEAERNEALKAYSSGRAQVIVNCNVLVEGWDDQPTSCIIILRLNPHLSAMIQMIGRGLRVVNPELYPDVIKTDCIIMDYGLSTALYGSLEQDAAAALLEREPGEAPYRICPECLSDIPAFVRECPICGHVPEVIEPGEPMADGDHGDLGVIHLTEIDLLKRSKFEWVDIFDFGKCLIAKGYVSWTGVFYTGGLWYAIGGAKDHGKTLRMLAVGDRMVCIACGDDWLAAHETTSAAHKSKSWLKQPASMEQLKLLGLPVMDLSLNKYRANCMLVYKWNASAIIHMIHEHAQRRKAA